jgi:phospholipase C
LLLVAAAPATRASQPRGISGIDHVVVIMQENHSFDNYFGTFPGANGIQNAPDAAKAQLHWITSVTKDPCHLAPCMQRYYDDGKMDGWTQPEQYGYYNATSIGYYWGLASNYTLFDNYFQGFMGPSLPNRITLLAGSNYGDTNDTQQFNGGHVNKTVFDLLNHAGVSWGYYDGFCCALNDDDPLPLFANTTASAYTDVYTAIYNHTLPQVSYVMPASEFTSEHAPQNVTAGEMEVKTLIDTIQRSPYWQSTAILLTWDESGGYYDHVAPPNATYGPRVPLIIVSPYAKHAYIDDTFSSHSSILSFIEAVFGLPCMLEDCHSSNLLGAFDLPPPSSTPPPPLGGQTTTSASASPSASTPRSGSVSLMELSLTGGIFALVLILLTAFLAARNRSRPPGPKTLGS